jgi:hypothetical protein
MKMRMVDKYLANMSKREIGDLLIEIEKDKNIQFGLLYAKIILYDKNPYPEYDCINLADTVVLLTDKEKKLLTDLQKCYGGKIHQVSVACHLNSKTKVELFSDSDEKIGTLLLEENVFEELIGCLRYDIDKLLAE